MVLLSGHQLRRPRATVRGAPKARRNTRNNERKYDGTADPLS
ncbi:MAG: hypothetical protein QOE58_514 [Actinomycetota bacterium]|jgi:hypothetical protein|nr:hypothetical protein [Actinomycetota bacterium]